MASKARKRVNKAMRERQQPVDEDLERELMDAALKLLDDLNNNRPTTQPQHVERDHAAGKAEAKR